MIYARVCVCVCLRYHAPFKLVTLKTVSASINANFILVETSQSSWAIAVINPSPKIHTFYNKYCKCSYNSRIYRSINDICIK